MLQGVVSGAERAIGHAGALGRVRALSELEGARPLVATVVSSGQESVRVGEFTATGVAGSVS
jgi:hypothetical protein